MNRITQQWTSNTSAAFGDIPTIKKGRVAEQVFAYWANTNGYNVTDNESDRQLQLSGCDVTITKGNNVTHVDIKGNVTDGRFIIEIHPSGWLFSDKKTSDHICHVGSTSNNRTYVCYIYPRVDMQKWIKDNYKLLDKYYDGTGQYFMTKITANNRPDFIKKIVVRDFNEQ